MTDQPTTSIVNEQEELGKMLIANAEKLRNDTHAKSIVQDVMELMNKRDENIRRIKELQIECSEIDSKIEKIKSGNFEIKLKHGSVIVRYL